MGRIQEYIQDQIDREQFDLMSIDVGGLVGTFTIEDEDIMFDITFRKELVYHEIVYTTRHVSIACTPKYLHHLIDTTFETCRLPHCDFIRCSFSDLCEVDYIYNYTRDDNCCVCMENGGCWVRLSCKHYVHSSCWTKVCMAAFDKSHSFATCPMCRNRNFPETTDYTCMFID